MNMMLISVVFSFRNEEENIPELVRRVTEAEPPLLMWAMR